MPTGVSTICFAASYAVVLALELSRLLFRSRVRSAVMLLFAGAGLIAHTWYLALLAVESPAREIPLSGWNHWFLVAAWLLAVVYLYLTFYHPQNPIGIFVLPLVLLLIGVGYAMRNTAAPPPSESAAAWLWIHVIGLLLGTVAVLVGFAAGVMYLAQAWRLKHKHSANQRLRLPSLEWLQRVNARSLVISALLVAVGFIAGLVRNARLFRDARGLPWTDPAIWTTALLMGWLVAAVIFNAVYRPSRTGRKIAYLTVASFVFLVLALAVVLWGPSAHSTQRAAEEVLPGRVGARTHHSPDATVGASTHATDSFSCATGSASAVAALEFSEKHCWASQQWHPAESVGASTHATAVCFMEIAP